MLYLTPERIIELHRQLIERTGGAHGLRDLAALEAAAAQPPPSFEPSDLYPALAAKAAALAYALIQNHPFIDGNKRIGHVAMTVTLVMNGYRIEALFAEQEQVILEVAGKQRSCEALTAWLAQQVVPLYADEIEPYLKSKLIH